MGVLITALVVVGVAIVFAGMLMGYARRGSELDTTPPDLQRAGDRPSVGQSPVRFVPPPS